MHLAGSAKRLFASSRQHHHRRSGAGRGSPTLLSRRRNQLVYPLTQCNVVPDEREQSGAQRQVHSQRLRMSQPPAVGDCCVAL